MSRMTARTNPVRTLGRGLDSINLNNADRLRREAQRSAERSRTRTRRSWAAVGDALREQMDNYATP